MPPLRGELLGLGHHQAQFGVLGGVGEAFLRIGGVHRDVGGARLEHGEQHHDQIERAFQADADHVTGTHTQVPQPGGVSGGLLIELPVGQRPVLEGDGGCVRASPCPAAHGLLDAFVGHVDRAFKSSQAGQSVALGVVEQGEAGERGVGVGRHQGAVGGRQHAGEPAHRVVVEGGAPVTAGPGEGRGAVVGEVHRQVVQGGEEGPDADGLRLHPLAGECHGRVGGEQADHGGGAGCRDGLTYAFQVLGDGQGPVGGEGEGVFRVRTDLDLVAAGAAGQYQPQRGPQGEFGGQAAVGGHREGVPAGARVTGRAEPPWGCRRPVECLQCLAQPLAVLCRYRGRCGRFSEDRLDEVVGVGQGRAVGDHDQVGHRVRVAQQHGSQAGAGVRVRGAGQFALPVPGGDLAVGAVRHVLHPQAGTARGVRERAAEPLRVGPSLHAECHRLAQPVRVGFPHRLVSPVIGW
jgi:hypothetical protein